MSEDLKLDSKTEQGFCQYYNSLDPPQHPNTIRVFERSSGDYYSVHGQDAQYVSQLVYKTTTVLKYINRLPSCTMSQTVAHGFLRDALTTHQLRVEIYRQADQRWGLWKTASPGNLQQVEELLFSNTSVDSQPVVISVVCKAQMDQMLCGVAYVNSDQRVIGVCEFIDNDVFSVLESLVIQLGVREALVGAPTKSQQLEHARMQGVLERCGVLVTECPRANFNHLNVEQDLSRLLEDNTIGRPELEMQGAMGALNSIILYLNLLMDEGNYGNYRLHRHSLSQFMKLDAAALQALNLMPSPQDGGQSMSLLGLLNRCKTPQGKRMLGQWLKQPLLDLELIEDRLGLVEWAVEEAETRDVVRSTHMRAMPDFKRLAGRFDRGFATLQDIVRMYQVVISLPALLDALPQDHQLVAKYYLESLRESTVNLQSFRELVETTVDLDMVDNHEYMLRADFDEELQMTKAQMASELQKIMEEQERVSEALNLEMDKKLKLDKHTSFGYCLRVTRADASKLRSKAKYLELSTQKTGVFFTTPALREASQKYRELSRQYDKTQATLVREVIKVAASYSKVLEALNQTVAHLDCILSMAEVSATATTPYVRPQFTNTGSVKLVGARHPCLEVQEGVDFIPNDVRMVQEESEFLIITGPNMGGKSTYIRQVGVIVLMAQIGCFVPCQEAELYLFDSILARVGAGDAQLKGVSTFMAEMLETASILKTATKRSLVIVDELGRGTSTYDGFGLAYAISEHIVKEIGCKCLFATHFHELTEIANEYKQVDNLHVMAHVGEGGLTLLYKVADGVCEKSFGIHVAELANFPESVVRVARQKVGELEDTGKMEVEFSQQQMAQGSRMMEEFLKAFTNTPGLSSMSPEEVAQRVNELKDKYQEEISGNPWIQHVISTL